ncbi:MAG: hypothetical protein EOP24_26650 [Hyphomicrobiales bacterium]|nr:MAG: hypothetical protein EOP24_26650 [Hyphomicrobiales bacterium]
MQTASQRPPFRPADQNAWLPSELQQHATRLFCAPRTHQSVVLHGITLRDHTAYLSGSEFLQGLDPEQLWLGLDFEGRGLRPEQALEVAEALRLMALAHMKRVAAMGRGHA